MFRGSLRVFVVAQMVVAILAALTYGSGPIPRQMLLGVLGAQASLLGLWLSLGNASAKIRWLGTIIGIVWLTFAMMLRTDFNGWELLLLVIRVALVAYVLWNVFRRHHGRVLQVANGDRASGDEDGIPAQFKISHLLLITFAVALAMVIGPIVNDTAVAGIVFFVFVLGLAVAANSLIACWAVFGRGAIAWRVFSFVLVALLIAAALAIIESSQTQAPYAGSAWFLMSAVEAAFAAFSMAWIHRLGYRIR